MNRLTDDAKTVEAAEKAVRAPRYVIEHDTVLGSRIVEVHNSSSLFTADAGQGESNIRRGIIDSDWLKSAAGDDENSDLERED